VKASVDLRMLAKNALNPIEKKLKGVHSASREKQEKEISTSNLVQMLIQEATSPANLVSETVIYYARTGANNGWQGRMYSGWAAWH
jgi:serine/threonine-protein kinase ATR